MNRDIIEREEEEEEKNLFLSLSLIFFLFLLLLYIQLDYTSQQELASLSLSNHYTEIALQSMAVTFLFALSFIRV